MTRSHSPRPLQHEIGDFGERFVANILPSAWVIHSYKGSEDYGIDYHVEVFSDGLPAGLEFGIQVKTVSHLPPSPKFPTVTITTNNLLYMASKPYPCMLVLVSQAEKRAMYTWIGEVFTPDDLIMHLRGRDTKKNKIRVKLPPENVLDGATSEIVNYLLAVKQDIAIWLADESHRQFMTDIYFDLHATLDALIECLAVIHKSDRTEDEVTHKATFSITLTLMAYGVLYKLTQDSAISSLGPAGPTTLALRRQFRRVISEIMCDQYITQYEQLEEQFAIIPASIKPFWPAVPRLTALLRDALRAFGRTLAPWRDFNMKMSGLASTVIEYPHR